MSGEGQNLNTKRERETERGLSKRGHSFGLRSPAGPSVPLHHQTHRERERERRGEGEDVIIHKLNGKLILLCFNTLFLNDLCEEIVLS